MRVVVIRHHTEDYPGFIEEAFLARGAELTSHLFLDGGELPSLDGVDHVVLLGAIPSVNDEGPGFDWIGQELDWLRRAEDARVPVLGICFGAQALCVAFGGKVDEMPALEVGWTVIDTVDPELVPAGPWLEFHGDHCLPPPEARILATSDRCIQAFVLGRHLAVQFHPEVDGTQLSGWLNNGARAEADKAGQDPDALLAQAYAEEPEAARRADVLVATALRVAAEARGAAGHASIAPPAALR
ncbi:MAG TPA: gamma-glutamyl-gamma-aminobutyrate hydrolase family protein [Streptosporangiaceae bacterium]|nr:gamma-glutamyl-gamma-aminobutyrate hydrolase family protein [Streptosporangiaceae bacterium]